MGIPLKSLFFGLLQFDASVAALSISGAGKEA
jgi:hypothetical protein